MAKRKKVPKARMWIKRARPRRPKSYAPKKKKIKIF